MSRALRSVKTIEVAGSLPAELDTAGVALDQAAGILDVLTVACKDIELPDTHPGSLVRTLYAALGEVRRASEALFGEVQS